MKTLSDEDKEQALALAAQGMPIRKIREVIGCSQRDLSNTRIADPKFDEAFLIARNDGLDELGESVLEIHEEHDDVQVAKVHSDNLKWFLSKMKPQTYGDRIDITVNKQLSLRDALAEANARRVSGARDVGEIEGVVEKIESKIDSDDQ